MAEVVQYDLWADGYGEQYHLLKDTDEYPYSGYTRLLNEVYRMVHEEGGKKVFDVGFGTGILTKKLYEEEYQIVGVDLSEQLVELAKEAMPDATFFHYDITMGLPYKLLHKKFDVIYSTYTFHHLDRFEKPRFMKDLLRHLNKGGKLIIGDLAFETLSEVKEFRKQNKDAWSSNDMYLIFEEVRKDFPDAECIKISDCAGLVVITKES